MNTENNILIISLLSVVCLMLSSCASTPQFIPKELENQKISELAKLNISNAKVEDLYIDGNKVNTNLVYLKPGTHTFQYNGKVITAKWANKIQSMVDKGYKHTLNDGLFILREKYSGIELKRVHIYPLYEKYMWKEIIINKHLKNTKIYFLSNTGVHAIKSIEPKPSSSVTKYCYKEFDGSSSKCMADKGWKWNGYQWEPNDRR